MVVVLWKVGRGGARAGADTAMDRYSGRVKSRVVARRMGGARGRRGTLGGRLRKRRRMRSDKDRWIIGRIQKIGREGYRHCRERDNASILFKYRSSETQTHFALDMHWPLCHT